MASHPLFLKIAGADARVLGPDDPFAVSCDTKGCDANCCTHSAPVILNPYEISLICSASGMSYEDLLDIVETDRANGFPLVMLPRNPACHFWSGGGCRVYRARPLACRLYPLGRVFEHGMSHIVQPSVNACSRVQPASGRTVAQYLTSQVVDVQMTMADRWIEFVCGMERFPLQDAPVTSVAFHMLVYSPDTPPAKGTVNPALTAEERFLLRLASAREQLPRFLNRSRKS